VVCFAAAAPPAFIVRLFVRSWLVSLSAGSRRALDVQNRRALGMWLSGMFVQAMMDRLRSTIGSEAREWRARPTDSQHLLSKEACEDLRQIDD
jgi:hypothetical protein